MNKLFICVFPKNIATSSPRVITPRLLLASSCHVIKTVSWRRPQRSGRAWVSLSGSCEFLRTAAFARFTG